MASLSDFPPRNFPRTFSPSRPERVASSLTDTDLSTGQTVRKMGEHIAAAQTDPLFLAIARNVPRSQSLHDIVWGTFLFCRRNIDFKSDEGSIFALTGERDQVDLLIEPRVLARMARMSGDCDEFTMFSLAILKSWGVPCGIRTVKADRKKRPGEWTHVYGFVEMQDGSRLPLDCSPAGKYVGWQVPAYDIQQLQDWDLQGNPLPAEQPRKNTLHAYVPRGMGQSGEVGSEGGGIPGSTDFSSGETLGGPISFSDWLAGLPRTTSGGGYTQPGSSGFNWNQLFSQLATVGNRLGTIALTPRGATVQEPGLVVSNAGGFLPGTFGSGGISMTTILIIAALGFGVMLVAGKK